MIGCFFVEGLYCLVHCGFAPGPSAVVKGLQIVDVSRSAREHGVRPTQSKRQARLCSPSIQFFEYDEAKYRDLLKPYLDRCYALTPVIEPLDGQQFIADFRGCSTGSDPTPVLQSLFNDLDQIDLSVYAGFAPSKFLAWSISRAVADAAFKSRNMHSGVKWLHCKEPDVALAISKLPVRYIWGLDESMPSELEVLGLKTFSAVAAAGTQNLVRRYGKRGKKIHAYSTGMDNTPVLPLYPPKKIVAIRAFETLSESGVEAYAAITDIALEMYERLWTEGLACQRLTLLVEVDSSVLSQTRDFPRPIFGAKQLAWALVRTFSSIGFKDDLNSTENTANNFSITTVKRLAVEASALCSPSRAQASLEGDLVRNAGAQEDRDRCLAAIAPALHALERRYGSGLIASCNEILRLTSRRESMLSYWDPVRWRDTRE